MLANVRAAAAATWTSFQEGSPDSLQEVVEAEVRVVAAATNAALPAATRSRLDWIRLGERPSPIITRLITGVNRTTLIPSMVGANGQESTDPGTMANSMLGYWEGISNADTRSSPVATEAVLTALHEHSATIPRPHSAVLGVTDISQLEITAALRRAKPGKSPGVDGIQNELYAKFPAIFIPFFLDCSLLLV